MGKNIALSQSGSREMVRRGLPNPPSFPPLNLTGEWFSQFLGGLFAGMTMEEAVFEANRRCTTVKDFSRMSLDHANGEMIKLSIALEGGNRILRTMELEPSRNKALPSISQLRLSDHGNWRKNHLGAFESILGKKPYYRHLEPGLKAIYLDTRIEKLGDFNTAIFGTLFAFLMRNVTASQLREAQFREAICHPAVKARGRELADQIDKEVSLLQSLSEHGPETLLGLIVNLADIS
ncbi:MAG: WbqC family protein [Muribaculaceae bacterium]|nr:WbqC family protein [Muribaculaceae bacterium]